MKLMPDLAKIIKTISKMIKIVTEAEQ